MALCLSPCLSVVVHLLAL
jgi:hypothetical protein